MSAGPLNCQELVELITDYLDGELSPTDRRDFELHIATCPGCRTYLSQIQSTRRAAATLSPEDIEPDAERALLEVFADWRSTRNAR